MLRGYTMECYWQCRYERPFHPRFLQPPAFLSSYNITVSLFHAIFIRDEKSWVSLSCGTDSEDVELSPHPHRCDHRSEPHWRLTQIPCVILSRLCAPPSLHGPGCVRTSESPTLSPWIETTPKQDLSSRIPWKIRGQHTSWGNFIWDTTFFPSLSRTPLAVSPGSDSLISHVHINFHLRVCCWGTNLRYPTFIKILSII